LKIKLDLAKKLKSTEYSSFILEEKWEPQSKAMQIIIDAIG
jgi:hypothetical protein